jgi:hypothetical protein
MTQHYVQFIAADEAVICSEFAGPQDIDFFPFQGIVEGDDPRYLAFIGPPVPTEEQLSIAARATRELKLRGIYDAGIMMALRALRMATTPEQESYANGKISELDAYAEALLAIPDQPGFPATINWPTDPTK